MKQILYFFALTGWLGISWVQAQGVLEPDGKYHYRHRLRTPTVAETSALSESKASLIQEEFSQAYQKAKKPRLLFLLNERILEGIEDPFEVASQVDVSVQAQGTLPVDSPDQTGLLNVQVDSNTSPHPSTVDVDGEVKASAKTYRKKENESLGPRLDPLEKRELETIFTEPFLEAGGRIVEKDLLLDTNLSHWVPRLLSHKEGEQPAAKIKAVLDKSDWLVECVVYWKSQRVTRASGDITIDIPYGVVRVVDLKTSQVIARTTSRSLYNPHALATLSNLNTDIEAPFWEALAYDTMTKLSRRLSRPVK